MSRRHYGARPPTKQALATQLRLLIAGATDQALTRPGAARSLARSYGAREDEVTDLIARELRARAAGGLRI